MDPQQRPLMSDRVTVNGIVTPLALLADGRLWWSEGIQRCLSVEKDVLSFVTSGPYIKIKSLVETRDGCCSTGAPASLARNDVVFMPSSEESHRLWCQKLSEFVDSLGRPKRLFVFVNPFGGKKSATKIFDEQVKPLLEDAQIEITVQETKHQLHAKEVTHLLDITKYDGIVCVSGDGLLVETLHILVGCKWTSSKRGLENGNKDTPWGSSCTGNGMAKSLLDSVGDPCEVANVVHAIIRGFDLSMLAVLSVSSTRHGCFHSTRSFDEQVDGSTLLFHELYFNFEQAIDTEAPSIDPAPMKTFVRMESRRRFKSKALKSPFTGTLRIKHV